MNTSYNNTLKMLAFFTVALSIFALGGCANTPRITLSPSDEPPSHDYLIGPGDAINIIVWHNPEVSMSVPVRPDGKITTPLVEDLPAMGKTSTHLARDIEKALAIYIQDPIVTVIVTNFVGPYTEQIRVIGEAATPQALSYKNGMSLMDVLIAVGGVTDYAAGNKASVIRKIDGKLQHIAVRLEDLIQDADLSTNIPMRPGDVLVIPESFF
ncbi:XrtA/PEP-CTERM system exopolysaccharide export protein [Candidatus Nitrotoga sp. M5]|uniref:XrtA/PEP-CTERM system exopolysaccharide export protein n=1 Tax=Candidatus Nitrotoga sp. M5 TaxID=2890409 RepID=UPI001EF2E2D3|nr:XrtA/PEP-CTERM system exopolysaccharide export protein [Candidatus Nitrotoga sp. M5]CAH1385691.1 Polysaccharide export outer membrane protein [Candidatus Nitrotoga sp. M5]